MFSYYRVNEKCIGKSSDAESTPECEAKMFYEHRSTWLDLVTCYCSKNYFYVGGYFSLSHCVWIPSELILCSCSCVCVFVYWSKYPHSEYSVS